MAASNDVKSALAPNHFVDVSGEQSEADYAATRNDPEAFAHVRTNIARNLLQNKPNDILNALSYALEHIRIRATQENKATQVGRMGLGRVNE